MAIFVIPLKHESEFNFIFGKYKTFVNLKSLHNILARIKDHLVHIYQFMVLFNNLSCQGIFS